MKKITLLCLYLFALNASAMSDDEFCNMLDLSQDPNGAVEHLSETYFEGKTVKENAQEILNYVVAKAVSEQGGLPYESGAADYFVTSCLEHLKEYKKDMFESD